MSKRQKPTHYTEAEVRRMLYDQLHGLCAYWSTIQGKSERDKMEGLCFSILSMFDGATIGMPAMDIVLSPHPDDKDYYILRNKKWFKKGMVINNVEMHSEFVSKPSE